MDAAQLLLTALNAATKLAELVAKQTNGQTVTADDLQIARAETQSLLDEMDRRLGDKN